MATLSISLFLSLGKAQFYSANPRSIPTKSKRGFTFDPWLQVLRDRICSATVSQTWVKSILMAKHNGDARRYAGSANPAG